MTNEERTGSTIAPERAPGAWVVRQDDKIVYGWVRDDFALAWSFYAEMAREWADESDADYEAFDGEAHTGGPDVTGLRRSDRATVDSMLGNHVPDRDHNMTIHTNIGYVGRFSITWDTDVIPDY
jgi:hypothetical protein